MLGRDERWTVGAEMGSATGRRLHVGLDLRTVTRTILRIDAGVIAAGAAAALYSIQIGTSSQTVQSLLDDFDMDKEANVPTLWSALLLFAAAACCWGISSKWRREGVGLAGRWRVLSVLLALGAVDEVSSFHELIVPINERVDLPSWLSFAWVIPAFALVGAVAIGSAAVLRRLPRSVALWFLASGGLYVFGAMGLEMVGGVLATEAGQDTLRYVVETIVEEAFEVIGMSAFIVSAARYLALPQPDATLVGNEQGSGSSE